MFKVLLTKFGNTARTLNVLSPLQGIEDYGINFPFISFSEIMALQFLNTYVAFAQ